MEEDTITLEKTDFIINTHRTEPARMINGHYAYSNEQHTKLYGIVELCQYTFPRSGKICLGPVMDGNEWCCNLHQKFVDKFE
jgi:hypothetical protein